MTIDAIKILIYVQECLSNLITAHKERTTLFGHTVRLMDAVLFVIFCNYQVNVHRQTLIKKGFYTKLFKTNKHLFTNLDLYTPFISFKLCCLGLVSLGSSDISSSWHNSKVLRVEHCYWYCLQA